MFLDTSGLFNLMVANEPFHAKACELYAATTSTAVTQSYVLSEFVALSNARKVSREKALRFVLDLIASKNVETVWADEALTQKGFDLLLARPDKGYSLCDAVSFVVMKQYGLSDALTSDHHFTQEGFRKLLG